MDASLYVAKTGLNAQQTRMTVIANNLANVNTVASSAIARCLKTYFISTLAKRVDKPAPTVLHPQALC